MSVEQAKLEVFDAFDTIIRQGYRGRGRVTDIELLPTPNAALDRLIATVQKEISRG